MKKFLYILLSIFVGISLVVGAGVWYVNSLFNEVFISNEEDPDAVDPMTSDNLKDKNDNVENFALFGVDCRTEGYEGCRSDVVMVVSYNKDTNKATLISVPRDTYVEIKDRGYDKINHAYAFGGPSLAVQTLNRTLDLDIEHYLSLNFSAVEAIINAIGGVNVTLDSYEINEFNALLTSIYTGGGSAPVIGYAGEHTLNGVQADAYMRIRKVGNGDFERMERQREVMESALQKISKTSLPDLIGLVEELLPLVRTNMPSNEVISLLTAVLGKGIPTLEQMQIPAQENGIGTTINGIYYFVPNTLLESVTEMHELIHPKTEYVPSETLKGISKTIESHLY